MKSSLNQRQQAKGNDDNRGPSQLESNDTVITAMAVEDAMKQLNNQIQDVKKQSVQKQETGQKMTIRDINFDMLEPFDNKEKADNKNTKKQENLTSEENVELIFTSNLNQQQINEKIKALREHPEVMAKYVKDQAVKQKQHEQELKIKQLNQQMLHRKQMAVLTQSPVIPVIEDHNKLYKTQIKQQYFAKPTVQTQIAITAEKNFQKQIAVLQKKDEMEITKAAKFQIKENAQLILPQTFISQRKQLQRVLFLASRFSVLFVTSSQYSRIRVKNEEIERDVNLIRKQILSYSFQSLFIDRQLAVDQLQRILRRKTVAEKNSIRLQRMKEIKDFAFQLYYRNSFLGSVNAINKAKDQLKATMDEQIKADQARAAIIFKRLKLIDWEIIYKDTKNPQPQEKKQEIKQVKKAGQQIKVEPVQQIQQQEIIITFETLEHQQLDEFFLQYIAQLALKCVYKDKDYDDILAQVVSHNIDSRSTYVHGVVNIPDMTVLVEIIKAVRQIPGLQGISQSEQEKFAVDQIKPIVIKKFQGQSTIRENFQDDYPDPAQEHQEAIKRFSTYFQKIQESPICSLLQEHQKQEQGKPVDAVASVDAQQQQTSEQAPPPQPQVDEQQGQK